MVIRILLSILFLIGMVFHVIFAVRKGNRDYEEMIRSDREHDKWMVDFGREFKREEEER